MTRAQWGPYVFISAVIGATPMCATTQGRDVGKSVVGSERSPAGDDSTRSARIEPMTEPFGTPFILDATLHARRLENGASVSLGEVRDGGTVKTGDRLQVFVRTSYDAHMYVAFCSKSSELTVFPTRGSIVVKANEVAIAPNRAAEIVLDDNAGQEVLYVILSRGELSASDPRISEEIAQKRGTKAVDCGDPLRIAARGAPKVTTRKGAPSAGQTRRTPVANPGRAIHAGRVTPPPEHTMVVSTDTGEPILDPLRGGEVVWMNGSVTGMGPDATGLVVLRYGLTHVSAVP